MAKIKMQTAITKPQFDFLSAEAGKLGITVADVIRRVLDEHMAHMALNAAQRILDGHMSRNSTR